MNCWIFSSTPSDFNVWTQSDNVDYGPQDSGTNDNSYLLRIATINNNHMNLTKTFATNVPAWKIALTLVERTFQPGSKFDWRDTTTSGRWPKSDYKFVGKNYLGRKTCRPNKNMAGKNCASLNLRSPFLLSSFVVKRRRGSSDYEHILARPSNLR